MRSASGSTRLSPESGVSRDVPGSRRRVSRTSGPEPHRHRSVAAPGDDEAGTNRPGNLDAARIRTAELCGNCRIGEFACQHSSLTFIAEQFRSTSQSLSRWSVSAVPAKLEQAVRDLADKTRLGGKTGKPGLFGRTSFWTRKQWAFGLGSAVATILIFGAVSPSNRKSVAHNYSVDIARVNAGQPSELGAAVGDGLPVNGRFGGFDKLVTQSSRGAVADSNGLFHGLGDHAQNSFTTNGHPGPMIAPSHSRWE